MLTLLEGGFHSKAHKELINRIKALVDDGKRCYLFVPEQQTLSAESETCEVLPPSAPRCFEVTNFTRFANTAFRQLGGIGGKYCTGAESSLIMWRVLSEHKDELTMCGGRKSLAAGTVERALGAVRELETHGISPLDISELLRGGRINDARLVAKLEDLFIIYSYYKRYVSDSYNNLAEDAEELAKRLEAQPEFLKDTHIFIDGFISFTEPQYRLLGVMMKCTDLTVTLTLPKARRRAFEYSEVVCTEKRLKEIARSEDVDVPISLENDFDLDCSYETCPARSETAKGCPRLLGYIADLLFETSGKIDNDCLQEIKKQGGRVRVFKAHTPFEECDFVASDIKRRMIESRGAESYSSFAIIARNADKYVGIIDESLRRAGIPYFISKKRDITSFEAIKLISIAYQIINRGFRREDVLTYAKCGLAGISHDECDEFELYTITWNIDGGRFVDGVEWRMNPRGYEKLTEDDHLKLLSIAQTREKIIEPLKAFAEAARAALTVREQATALFAFLSSIGLERALYERAQEMFSLGELDAAEENARLWKTVCSSLDTLVDVLGDKTADAEEFIGLLNVLFNEAAISVLPLSVDQVTVGSADTLRIGEKRHVYLIGVNAGEFPQNVTDLSYFNERDKATLKALNLPLEPELEIKNARELYCFTRAFLSARETVTLLYTELGAAMDALLPSDVIFRLESISTEKYTDEYGEQKRVHIRPVSITDEIRAIDRIYSPDDALLLSNELTDEEYRDVKAALGTVDKANIVAIAEMNPVNNSAWLDKDAIALLQTLREYQLA